MEEHSIKQSSKKICNIMDAAVKMGSTPMIKIFDSRWEKLMMESGTF